LSRDLKALSPAAALAALTLALILLLAPSRAAGVFVPPPEQEAESFLVGLRLRSYQAARNHLSASLRAQVSAQALADLERQIEARFGGFYKIEGVNADTRGQAATASVEIQLIDGRRATLAVPLSLERGLWRVTSIEPVEALLSP
jgi:hypothetical protein